ncbi:MAG: D-alanyl-D-alanine carboxypeptidase [Methylobacterium mesophilicum]|nr:D-alanyl-D-alanine carboxypeptidase [Methylobacterium mesophilicum]
MKPLFAFLSPLRATAVVLTLGLAGCSTSQTLDSVSPLTVSSYAPVNGKQAAIVIDGDTGKTLFESDSTEPRYPASLTKMMTAYMLFEAMQANRISPSTRIPVSAYAASQPPTKIGFRPGDTITVEDAILALVTKSANDVAVAVGEFMGGSEEKFAEQMTARARQIGMRNTRFRNASGLPNPEQQTTARDMALLGITLRKRFPQYFHYFSTQSFMLGGTKPVRGHNRLLARVSGADGIKTGYTRASGFNIVTSVNRDGKKLICVVMGGASAKARDDYAASLIDTYLPPVAPTSPRDTDPVYAPDPTEDS